MSPTAPRLLGLLCDGSLHSGAQLAAALGVSRAAVWKLVGELRAAGVAIDSLSRRGYRLSAPVELLDAARMRAHACEQGRRLPDELEVSARSLVMLLVVILPIILLGASVLTALAAFARSHREAQGYLPVLIFLPMVPTLFLMVAPVRTQLWMLAVPFLGQNQLILRVLRGETIHWWEWTVSLGVGFALVALVWFVAARLYHREQLATSA